MHAIITGGTKGIGAAIARRFAEGGFSLSLCARTESDLEAIRRSLLERHPGIEVFVRPTDVRRKEEVQAFGDAAVEALGPPEVLVNNAGIFLPGEIHKEADGTLEALLETNLYSAYHLTRHLLPAMLERRRGHIFNMCSIASLFAYPNGGSYSISKFALLGFSRVLREELKDKGIRVTSILPGATWSDSWKGADFPAERLMPAEDIAAAVWNAYAMSPATVVEEILLRPQLGDL